MTWAAFWAPNLIQWIVGAAISAVVAAVVGFLVRRWLRGAADAIFGEQQRTTAAARAAADDSRLAAEHAAAAGADAKTAGLNSEAANEAIVWLAGELAKSDAVTGQLRERIDRLLGTRARQLAAEHPHPPGLLIPVDAGTDDDPTTVTGKHRLHTQRLPTIDEGDRP